MHIPVPKKTVETIEYYEKLYTTIRIYLGSLCHFPAFYLTL